MKDDSNRATNMINARQYLLFPFHASARSSRLRSYCLLANTDSGKLVFVEIKHRKLTDGDIHEIISAFMADENPYAPHSPSIGRLYEMGLQATLLDEPINASASFCSPAILGEAILDDFLSRTRRGEQVTANNHRADLELKLRTDLDSGIAQFIGNLKKEIVQTISETGCGFTPSIYNYLAGGTAQESRNRFQAARVFPVLVPALATGDGLREVHKAILTRKPLVDAVANALNVPKSVARCLRGLSLDTAGQAWSDQPHALFRLLATLPPDFRPKDAEAWLAFNTAVQVISQASSLPPHCCTRSRLWLYACAARKFKVEDLGATLESAARDIDELTSALVAVINFELRREPRYKSLYAINAISEFTNTQADILKVARLAKRFEAAYLKESADFANTGEKALLSGVRWKSVLDAPFVTTLRAIHQLVTAEELMEEGADMGHCVGSYAIHCLSGDAIIFSVRDRDGRRCSTMQVSISQDKKGDVKVSIAQHKGKNNAEPSQECQIAALLLLRHLNQDTNLSAFLAWRKSIAGLGKDTRALLAITRPMVAALRKVLPDAWPLERFITLTRENANKGRQL